MTENPYDKSKVKRIVDVLITYPEGLWLRRLSQESRVPLTTLHRYLEGVLAPYIENVGVKNEEGRYFGVRVVRLRQGVRKHLQTGVSLDQLLRTGEIISQTEL